MLTRSAFCHLREKPLAAMLARPSLLAVSPASRMAAVAAFAIGCWISLVIVSRKPFAMSERAKRRLILPVALADYGASPSRHAIVTSARLADQSAIFSLRSAVRFASHTLYALAVLYRDFSALVRNESQLTKRVQGVRDTWPAD